MLDTHQLTDMLWEIYSVVLRGANSRSYQGPVSASAHHVTMSRQPGARSSAWRDLHPSTPTVWL